MNDSRFPTILYCVLLVLGVLQWAHVYPQLPAVMASHFSGYGVPNGWQPKPAFFAVMALVIAVTAIPTFLVPRRLPSLPLNESTCRTNPFGWRLNAARKPSDSFARKWRGSAVRCCSCCFTRLRKRSTRIFRVLGGSIGKECGTRWVDSQFFASCG